MRAHNGFLTLEMPLDLEASNSRSHIRTQFRLVRLLAPGHATFSTYVWFQCNTSDWRGDAWVEIFGGDQMRGRINGEMCLELLQELRVEDEGAAGEEMRGSSATREPLRHLTPLQFIPPERFVLAIRGVGNVVTSSWSS
jgi:hypothetical protein